MNVHRTFCSHLRTPFPRFTQPTGAVTVQAAGAMDRLNKEVTEAWFAIRGANLNLDESGNVASVWDATFILDTYLELCRQAGHGRPNLIVE